MKTFIPYCVLIMILVACTDKNDDALDIAMMEAEAEVVVSCSDAQYVPFSTSPYVLPFPIGASYRVDLNQCSSSYHAPGEADQFAVDFFMPIGTVLTASRSGTVVHVEESGGDFGFPNNVVVIKSGNTFDQYMHLTKDGALVAVGDEVIVGQEIGLSGATGLAGYPHLHFVVTKDDWRYPYQSVPYNFRNTIENPRGPESGVIYEALPY